MARKPAAATTVHATDASGVGEPPDPRRWLALPVTLAATFLAVLDFFIVNVSIPSIQRDLHASFAQIQLVIAGYALTYATFMITGGRLGDIFGRKRLFMLGMGGFTVTSAVCGLAPTPSVLIVSRIAQGLVAAMMIPQVLSIIQVTFPPEERGLAFGIYGTVIGAGSVAGQVAGGVLIQLNLFGLDWRPVFLVNLPIGVLALIAAVPLIRESRSPDARRLDLEGVALVTVGLFLLVYPLVEGREAGWPPWTLACLVASAPVLAGFVLFERWKTAHGGSPLVDLSLFRNRAFSLGLLIALVFFGGGSAFFLTLTLYLQSGLRYSPLAAGLTFAPFAVGFFAASMLSVRLTPRLGNGTLALGGALMAAGLAVDIFTVHAGGLGLPGIALAPGLLLYGAGQGMVTAPFFTAVLRSVPSSVAGSASGVLSTVQQVAGALGVAAIGLVYFGMLGNAPAPARYGPAFATALVFNIGLALATCLLVFFLPTPEPNVLLAPRPMFAE